MALATKIAPLPRPTFPWVDKDGRPSIEFAQFMQTADAALRLLATGQVGALTALATPTNANAAAAGVPIGGIYTSTANPALVYVRTA